MICLFWATTHPPSPAQMPLEHQGLYQHKHTRLRVARSVRAQTSTGGGERARLTDITRLRGVGQASEQLTGFAHPLPHHKICSLLMRSRAVRVLTCCFLRLLAPWITSYLKIQFRSLLNGLCGDKQHKLWHSGNNFFSTPVACLLGLEQRVEGNPKEIHKDRVIISCCLPCCI